MSKFFLITLLGLVAFQADAQDDLRSQQAQAVRAIVESLEPKRAKVTLLSRRLIGVKGKIVRSRADSFDLKVRGRVTTVPYLAVLEMLGGGRSISFVPADDSPNHGAWADIGNIYPATRIVVLLSNGKSVKGFSNSITETKLVMVDEKGRERVELPREQIACVYGLIGGYGGVKSGASKGVEQTTASGRDKLPGLVYTGISALTGLAKSDGRPILVYSK
jgi:hypothetical protein